MVCNTDTPNRVPHVAMDARAEDPVISEAVSDLQFEDAGLIREIRWDEVERVLQRQTDQELTTRTREYPELDCLEIEAPAVVVSS
jgi:hypothetical protein